MNIFNYWIRRLQRAGWRLAVIGIILLAGISLSAIAIIKQDSSNQNPLQGALLYRDADRPIVELANSYRSDNRTAEANALDTIASQPNTTWLTGPSPSDPTAARDIELIRRTSTEAAAEKRLPVYELYAIPRRDACAGYSAAGFQTNQEYLNWVDQLVAALKSPAVFSVEADAIAQTINNSCLSGAEARARYDVIKQAVTKIQASKYKTTIYIDAGHPEWFPDPEVLVGPLKASGIDMVRGVAVNVSFYESTDTSVRWAQRLATLLGDDKGVIIDTSRNGQGAPPQRVTGEARWCNAEGRGLGMRPTVVTDQPKIDAFLWIKNPGESDGSCFGNAPAGQLVPELAINLAKNARF